MVALGGLQVWTRTVFHMQGATLCSPTRIYSVSRLVLEQASGFFRDALKQDSHAFGVQCQGLRYSRLEHFV